MSTLNNSQKNLIIKLHQQSNPEMKADLEKAFEGDIEFKPSLEDIISKATSRVRSFTPYERSLSTEALPYGDEYIIVTLPNANTEWTFQAFDLVKALVSIAEANKKEAYPTHNFKVATEFLQEHGINNYIAVRVPE